MTNFKTRLTALASMLLLPLAGNATVLVFDGVVTGDTTTNATETLPDSQAGDLCGDLDICLQGQVFTVTGGSATMYGNNASSLPATAGWFAWYDRVPTSFGGMGASNNANDGGSDNLLNPNEWAIADFSASTVMDGFWMNGTTSAGNGHGSLTANVTMVVDGGANQVIACVASFCDLSGVALGSRTGSTFSFTVTTGYEGYLAGMDFTIPTIPEPASLALLGLGLAGLGFTRRRRTL